MKNYISCTRMVMSLALAAATFIQVNAQSAGKISGQVSDKNYTQFLAGALVRVEGTSLSTVTNRFGEYTLNNVPTGSQTIVFTYIGYAPETRPVTVGEGVLTLDVEMGEKVIDLDAYVITAREVGTARALNQQKSAESFRNIIASDAIGSLPDENVAEALNRVPGISIERDQGEGRYVVIRGIDPELNNIQVNGVSLSAPENETRQIALDVIPSELVSSLEITKVTTPDMDADAIGGTVDIKTRSPFSEDGRFIRVKSSLSLNELRGELGGKASVVWGDLFKEGTVGLTVAASYGEKIFASDNSEVDGPWVEEDGFYIPEEVEYREYDITRERRGLDIALEFKPDEDRYFYIKGLYNYFSDLEARYRIEIKAEDAEGIENLSATGATFTEVQEIDRDVKDRFEEQTIYAISAGGEHDFGSSKLDYKIGYSFAEESEPDRLDTDFRFSNEDFIEEFGQDIAPDIRLDWSGDSITLASVGPAFADTSVFANNGTTYEDNVTDEDNLSAEINYRKDFNWNDNFGFWKIGAKYATKEKNTNLSAIEFDLDGVDSLADVQDSTLGRNRFNQGPRANVNRPREIFNASSISSLIDGIDDEEDSIAGDYQSTEDILAAYGMAAVTFGNATITGGLRVEKTDFETSGFVTELDEEGDLVLPAASISQDKSYTDLFPHLSLKYNFNEDVIGRVAVTKTIARPRFKQTALRRFVNREDEEIEVGNPDLDPFESWNFDASIEFYSPNLGLFSAAVFYKNIDNYVFDLASELEDPETGFDLITFLNGQSAEIYGLEFAFNRELTFLPEPLDGFGIQANLTLSDSSAKTDIRPTDTLVFLKQADTIASFKVYYEKGGFSCRVAGTYRSDYIDEFGEETSEDRYVDEHFQMDLTASYDFNDQWTVFAEVINLNDESFRAYFDQSFGLSQYEVYSWSATLGVSWKL